MYYFVFCLIYFSSLNLLFNLKLKRKCSVTLRYQRFFFAISTSLICRGFFKNIFQLKKNHKRFLFIYIYIYIYILNKKIIYKIKKNIEFDDVHDLHQEFS
jgi:hypothetical protein